MLHFWNGNRISLLTLTTCTNWSFCLHCSDITVTTDSPICFGFLNGGVPESVWHDQIRYGVAFFGNIFTISSQLPYLYGVAFFCTFSATFINTHATFIKGRVPLPCEAMAHSHKFDEFALIFTYSVINMLSQVESRLSFFGFSWCRDFSQKLIVKQCTAHFSVISEEWCPHSKSK